MRANQFLTERATSVVYHYCGTGAGSQVMKEGVFRLSNITGNKSEQSFAPPGYPYFLSLTRSKTGDYHRYTGPSACMFVLDGDWLNQRYKTKPVDYWERAWNHPGSQRTREAEDRVFSKEPTIPNDCVRAIHLYLREQLEYRSAEVRQIMIAAKTRKIPVFLYTDETAWRLQDTRKAIKPSQDSNILKGPAHMRSTRYDTSFMEPWIELMHKSSKADLTPKAEKLRYKLVVYGYRDQRDDCGLGNDMSNARKPNSGKDYETANKITDYMRRNKFADTTALKNALADKWYKISYPEEQK